MNAQALNILHEKNRRCVLVVSSSKEITSYVDKTMAESGVYTLVAETYEQAVDFLLNEQVTYILLDASLGYLSCKQSIGKLRINSGDRYIPIILLVSTEEDEQLSKCLSSDCDDVLFKPFTTLALHARISTVDKICELRELYKESIDEQLFAKRILTNAMGERSVHFEAIRLLSLSKDVFSGDLFITSRHPDGSLNILIADFTGNGLSAAVGALPVADVFNAMTKKGFHLGYILENINNKLHTLLPTSMFMACSVLSISSDLKNVTVWNGGMPDIYIREYETGRVHHKIKSSHIPLGITDTIVDQYDLTTVELTFGDQLIMFTDGLTDTLNQDDDMFGEERLEDCLQKNHSDKSIFTALVNDFNDFRGETKPIDDVTFVCVPCTNEIMDNSIAIGETRVPDKDNNWLTLV